MCIIVKMEREPKRITNSIESIRPHRTKKISSIAHGTLVNL